MSQLIYLREQIEGGQTAKLITPPAREGGLTITVRVKKLDQYYWQRATITHPRVMSGKPNTAGYATWEQLLDGIDGLQTISIDWELCDDSLEDLPIIGPGEAQIEGMDHATIQGDVDTREPR